MPSACEPTTPAPAVPSILQHPIYTPQRRLKVVVIGAGPSGLLLAYKLQRHFADLELTVLEKNTGVAGTWFENNYPGCACDVPSHCYTWSFAPKTDWSATYAGSAEIRQYFTDFCHQHSLEKYIRLQHQVVSAEWNDAESTWRVESDNLVSGQRESFEAHIVINATGILNKWKWPAIDGLHDFKGTLLHSANWDQGADLAGKKVGLIGNGSTGIQILPAIQSRVDHVFHFIRQPTWVAPLSHAQPHVFSQEEKDRFAADPDQHLQVRKQIERSMNGTFETFRRGSARQQKALAGVRASMIARLGGDQEHAEQLLPSFPVGCRRPTPGVGYLEALGAPNVTTMMGAIERVTDSGLVFKLKGQDIAQHVDFDALICATGFDTSFKPRIQLRGRNGQLLSDAWKDETAAYLGVAVPGFPNYFSILGPNCPVGNGPVLPAVEAQVGYIMQMLAKFQKENLRAFDVDRQATQSFNAWKDEYMQHTVWTDDCRSWYKNGSASGKIVALWPGSTLHYMEALSVPRFEDWEWTRAPGANRWAFLGNGQSTAEMRGGDLAWYVSNSDTSPVDPCLQVVSA